MGPNILEGVFRYRLVEAATLRRAELDLAELVDVEKPRPWISSMVSSKSSRVCSQSTRLMNTSNFAKRRSNKSFDRMVLWHFCTYFVLSGLSESMLTCMFDRPASFNRPINPS